MKPAAYLLASIFLSACAVPRGRHVLTEVPSRYSAQSPEFRQAAGSLLGSNFVPGNHIESLVNGDQIFPVMLNAIRGAKQTIDFETFVYAGGQVGRAFAQALSERARAGVKVNVILDAQGTGHIGKANLTLMRNAGVNIEKYHPLLWWDIRRYNNRTHRKLLIVDGKTAFIGGVGIDDLWTGHAQSPEHWRDNHYRVTGPVVAQIQAVFIDNWLKTRGEVLHGPEYFPPLHSTGNNLAQAFKSSPRQGSMDLHLMYLLGIASAQKNLRIENAYFLPDALTRKELMAAARRGAKVEILVPGKHLDQKFVGAASKRFWPELIRAGVKIYEFEPTMVHVKLMIVDDLFVSVGSGNFDNRSILLNDEANLNVMDRRFAAEQTRLFEKDKSRSREMKLNSQGKVSAPDPLSPAATMASPQL